MKTRKQAKLGCPTTQGATLIEIYVERFKQLLGKILNYFHIPGFVKPTKIFDDLTKTRLEIKLSGFFTIISVDGRDYYFRRLSGKFDGTGMIYGCDNNREAFCDLEKNISNDLLFDKEK